MSMFLSAVAGQGGVKVPGAPGTLSLAAGTPSYSAINLSWSAPSDTGGGTISGYRIKKDGSVLVADTSSTGTTYTATGLTGSTSYNFNVAAINEKGTGADGNTPSLTTGLSPAGYSCGGYGPSFSTVDTVYKYSFSGDSWSTSGSTLNEAVRGGMGAQNDGTAGYMFGGYTSARRNTVKKLLFSSDATSVITATMAQGRLYGGSVSSATKAYQVGGNQSSPQFNSDGQVLLFSNETISTLSSMLSNACQSNAGISSIADGYGWSFGGYYSGPTYVSKTDKVQFSNDTISLDTGDIPSAVTSPTGMSNDGTAGYCLGGNDGSRVNTVFKMPFSSSTWSTLGATLSVDLDSGGPTSINLKDNFGLMCGGLPSSGSISTTNKLTFSSDSRSTGAALPADRAVTYAFQNQGL